MGVRRVVRRMVGDHYWSDVGVLVAGKFRKNFDKLD